MTFSELSCGDFAARLASREPTPGGGGASALVGAVAAALGGMVASLTLGKAKYADVQAEVARLQVEAGALQASLLELMDRDAAAFEPLSRAYALPRVTETEKALRAEVMEAALQDACAPPLGIMEACCEAAKIIASLARIGSRLAVSDAGCAAACCRAAVCAASLNVFVNTRLMADRERASALNARAQAMLDRCVPLCDRVYDEVGGLLREERS